MFGRDLEYIVVFVVFRDGTACDLSTSRKFVHLPKCFRINPRHFIILGRTKYTMMF